jgi:predicted NUDIX family phosphoesterase
VQKVSTFLDAAYRVLSEVGYPLTAVEITERALKLEIIPSTGKTPSQTMKSKLSTEILKRRERSPFMRTEAGKFALRIWQSGGDVEYVADRYVKALLREDAMVFPASSLSFYAPSPGLWELSPKQGERLIGECVPMNRALAEETLDVIQLVSGFIVQHRDQVLTYKRTKRLPEARLHGEYSVMFGGHLNPDDFSPMFNILDPNNASFMERELSEELRLKSSYSMRSRGILFDDGRPVSKQHLAIVFDVYLAEPTYVVGERGFLQRDQFETWRQIGERLEQFENWSQLLYGIYSH